MATGEMALTIVFISVFAVSVFFLLYRSNLKCASSSLAGHQDCWAVRQAVRATSLSINQACDTRTFESWGKFPGCRVKTMPHFPSDYWGKVLQRRSGMNCIALRYDMMVKHITRMSTCTEITEADSLWSFYIGGVLILHLHNFVTMGKIWCNQPFLL